MPVHYTDADELMESNADESMESEDDEWMTESYDGWASESDDVALVKSLSDVMKAAGKSFFTMMTRLEAKAEEKSAALTEALRSADKEEWCYI